MCNELCRQRRYTRRQLVTTGSKGLASASLAGAMLAAPWARPATARQETAEITWWV